MSIARSSRKGSDALDRAPSSSVELVVRLEVLHAPDAEMAPRRKNVDHHWSRGWREMEYNRLGKFSIMKRKSIRLN